MTSNGGGTYFVSDFPIFQPFGNYCQEIVNS